MHPAINPSIVTKLCLIGSAVFIALAFKLDISLMRFLLVGELPGNRALISPNIMLAILGFGFFVTLFALIRIIKGYLPRQSSRPNLPVKRYQSIQ